MYCFATSNTAIYYIHRVKMKGTDACATKNDAWTNLLGKTIRESGPFTPITLILASGDM